MTSADIFYRALRELFEELEQERGTAALFGSIAKAREQDEIVVTHNVCTIDVDWISAIERGLVYIGRAIEEDRQFIRSNGEVKPIEKVQHISKESVQHLSRHSDLLPKDRKKDEDIVPSKLYTVERLNDYAVYENRFLYVLLLRIRDFVGVRYEAIMRAYRKYRGDYRAKKTVVTGTRRLTYEISLTDEQDDIISAPADKACAESLERLDKIRRSVAFFLRTPLMVEVARADKIKSKITKTNVLRMNKNFHEALTLYEYLLAYDKDGYTIEERTEKLDPLPEEAARELALPPVLSAFLAYEHGLGLGEYLSGEYNKEEARREEEAKDAVAQAIKELKKRIEQTGEGAEQYMLMLERQNAALEKDRKLLQKARVEIEELKAEIGRLQAEIALLDDEIASLNDEIARLGAEIERIKEEHRRETEALKAAHAEELARMQEERRREIQALKAAHAEELSSLKAAHAEETARLKETQRAQIAALEAKHAEALARKERARKEENERLRADFQSRIRKKEEELSARRADVALAQETLKETQKTLSAVTRKCEVLGAELTAVRKEHGLLTSADDFTTEEGFNRLEHEFEVLGKLVRNEWKEAKKMLRMEFYEGIRATMRKKKTKKSKEYRALCEDLALVAGKAAESGENTGNSGNSENNGTAAEAEQAESKEETDGE